MRITTANHVFTWASLTAYTGTFYLHHSKLIQKLSRHFAASDIAGVGIPAGAAAVRGGRKTKSCVARAAMVLLSGRRSGRCVSSMRRNSSSDVMPSSLMAKPLLRARLALMIVLSPSFCAPFSAGCRIVRCLTLPRLYIAIKRTALRLRNALTASIA